MRLTITGYSTALFSTWIFLEEYGVLFDAGDGVSAGLLQKSRKATHVFISHADRDHLAGLLQLHQLNARDAKPLIAYPKDCGSFPALQQFMGKFDPDVGPATWMALDDGARVRISDNVLVAARRNEHVVREGLVKSMDFTLIEQRRKLKQEFRGRKGEEIARLRSAFGDDHVTQLEERRVVGYSGDSPQLVPDHWTGVEYLIHEATFLEEQSSRGAHANLRQVLGSAASLPLKGLLLTHFSSRYDEDEIVHAIRETAAEFAIAYPVHAILPGATARDVLASPPLWKP